MYTHGFLAHRLNGLALNDVGSKAKHSCFFDVGRGCWHNNVSWDASVSSCQGQGLCVVATRVRYNTMSCFLVAQESDSIACASKFERFGKLVGSSLMRGLEHAHLHPVFCSSSHLKKSSTGASGSEARSFIAVHV